MSFAPELKTHAQKVCNLYKQAMRTIESYYVASKKKYVPAALPVGNAVEVSKRDLKLFCGLHVVRYHQVLLRNRFDEKLCVCDPKEQRKLLWLGQDELFKKKHPIPLAKFATSLGYAQGVAYGRVVTPPDWVLDYWHPLEKAQYPCYFDTREKRKCEYIQLWNSGELR